jgi:hypothetical protein
MCIVDINHAVYALGQHTHLIANLNNIIYCGRYV